MGQRYLPTSPFLVSLYDGEVPLPGDESEDGERSAHYDQLCEANLQVLIRATREGDATNRDWAAFFLARMDVDTPAVRAALVDASSYADDNASHEALWGLARRDTGLALPLVLAALQSAVSVPLAEAAELCADPSLVADLRAWAEEPGCSDAIYSYLAQAIAACEGVATAG